MIIIITIIIYVKMDIVVKITVTLRLAEGEVNMTVVYIAVIYHPFASQLPIILQHRTWPPTNWNFNGDIGQWH